MIALVREADGVSWDVSQDDVLALFGSSAPQPDDALLLMLRDANANGGLVILLMSEPPPDIPATIDSYDVRLMAGQFGGAAARVFSVRLRPGVLQQMVSAFQNLTMRAATGQQGFRGGLLLVAPDRDRVLSIGIWEDMARLEASATSGYLADQVSAYLPYFHETPAERRMHVIQPHDVSTFQ